MNNCDPLFPQNISYRTSPASGGTKSLIQEKLLAGESIQLDRTQSIDQRTVSAEWIHKSLVNGKTINLENAVIVGRLELRYFIFEIEFVLRNCWFVCAPNFSRCIFKRNLDLSGSVFQRGCKFQGASLEGDCNLSGAVFLFDEANFMDVYASGVFIADGSRFYNRAIANFHRAHFGKSAFFRGAIFKSEVSFLHAQIEATAEFQQTFFKRKAMFGRLCAGISLRFDEAVFKGTADFNNIAIEGSAIFDGVRFLWRGPGYSARFDEATFGNAGFQGAIFLHDVTFNGCVAKGSLFFRAAAERQLRGAVFAGKADFIGACTNRNLEFTEAVFSGLTQFGGAEIGGRAIFRRTRFLNGSCPSFARTHFKQAMLAEGVYFEDVADFQAAQFDTTALFHGANFLSKAKFHATHFGGFTNFSSGELDNVHLPGATFSEVSFDHARFETGARFDATVFRGPACFFEASLRGMYLAESGKVRTNPASEEDQFQDSVDLRGCVYDRIQCDWKSVLCHSDRRSRLDPYDRQPYLQLEKAIRITGKDAVADAIYLERQYVERKQKFASGHYGSWIGSWVYRLVANYGVRPYRLIVFPLVLLALGTITFSQHGAVRPKSAEHSEPGTAITRLQKQQDLGWPDALRLSARLLLPVETPFANRWEPSDQAVVSNLTFSDIASVLKIAGWILVPLGVASLTGLLRRSGSVKP